MDSLSTVLLGVAHGQAKLADMDQPMTQFGQVLAAAAQGKTDYLSWRSLITGSKPRPEELRRFITVKPKLFYDQLEPGLRASNAIREAARQLGLTQAHGVRVRLTGDVALSDEEFATLTDRVWLMVGGDVAGVLPTLWLALRSFKVIFAILATLVAGLSITMGLGLFGRRVQHHLHRLHRLVRGIGCGFRDPILGALSRRTLPLSGARRMRSATPAAALGVPLALAAAATAVGFFSFLPTNYTGVAELGFVAGMGMIVAFPLPSPFCRRC